MSTSLENELAGGVEEQAPARPKVFTLRAILLSLGVVVLFSWAVPYNDYYLKGTFLTGNHLPLGAVFLLSILILLLNPLLALINRKFLFSSGELIVVWSLMIVVAGIPSSGFSRYFYSLLAGPAYYANPTNRWGEFLLPYLNDGLLPGKSASSPAIKYFFESLPEDEAIPWGAWETPLLNWSIFIACFFTIMWCLCVILRKQWVEGERLNFPLVHLPMEMAANPEKGKLFNRFFRSSYTWIGFSIPVFIHVLNGLQKYFRDVPTVTLYFPLRPMLTEAPWSAAQVDAIRIYPSVVAFMYLVSLDVSFSLWFFYLLLQGEYVAFAWAGSPLGGDWNPPAVHQQAGAFLILALLLLWRARRHLTAVFRKAFFGAPDVDDSQEAMSYRAAVFGLLGSILIAAFWCRHFGMHFWAALVGILIIVAILIVLTRLVAQGGMLFIYQNFVPFDLLATSFGTAFIGPATLSLMAIQNIIFIHDAREVMMPSAMNAIRISEASQVNPRKLMRLIVPGIILAIVCSGFFFLRQTYTEGGANLDPFGMNGVFGFKLAPMARLIQNETTPDWDNLFYMGYGAALMAFVFSMGNSFHWWPLHPLGILMANSYAMRHFWFSIMMGWACKWGIMKFGGGRSYRLMRNFFLGGVVGECFIGCVWILIGFMVDVPRRINIMPP